MTVWTLLVYSCVTLTSLQGDLTSKTCSWNGGALYRTEGACGAAAPKIGTPIFSDVADGRKVEKTRCDRLSVAD